MKRILSLLLLFVTGFSLYAQTTAVGTTEGVFNVSDLGAATYTIPIKIPDGVAGLQPGLSLSYSSQAGNGLCGTGWNLSGGISAISRVPNTIYNDKKVTGISLTAEDRFALDGQRLIITNGTYGATNSVYHTEVESFKDIKAIGTLGSGPMSFEVTDLNTGTKFIYGTKAMSRPTVQGKAEPYLWLLDKVTDLNGNYMEFTYQYSAGEEPRIAYINYTGNVTTGAAPKSVISFYYENRPDANFSYIAGGKIAQGQRLKSIYIQQKDAANNPVTVHSYELQYSLDQYSHLAKVIEKGNEVNGAAEQLPGTEMTYNPAMLSAEMITESSVGSWKETEGILGDFNADGFTDIIRYDNPVQTGSIYNMAFHLYLNNGNGGFNWAQNGEFISEAKGAHDQIGRKDLFSFLGFGEDYHHASTANNLPFDVNGDGFEDIMYRQNYDGEYVASLTGFSDDAKSRQIYSIYYSNGSTIGNSRVIKPMPNRSFYETRPYVGDFDGDGLSEVLLLNTMKDVGITNNYLIGEQYLTNANMNTATGQPIYLATALPNMSFDAAHVKDKESKILVFDYNGDGKSDILSIWHDNVAGVDHAQVLELNVTFDANNKPVLGSPVFKLINDTGYPTLYHEIYPGDFNGDKITDVLTWNGNVGWEIGYGKGNGQMNDIHPMQTMNSGLSILSKIPGTEELRPVVVSDYNGDGKSDIFDLAVPSLFAPVGPARILYSLGNDNFQQEALSNIDVNKLTQKLSDFQLADFNGDGQAEIYIDNPINKQYPNSNNTDSWYAYIFRFHAWENRHIVNIITNGLGSPTYIGYQTLATLGKLGAYTPSAFASITYPYFKKTVPIKVVSAVHHDVGEDGNPFSRFSDSKLTLFSYQGFKYNTHGKGIMGFDKVTIKDNNKNIIQEKTFTLNTAYALPYLESTIIKTGQGQPLSTAGNVQQIYDYGNKRILPYTTQTTAVDYIKNTTVNETYTYSWPVPNIFYQSPNSAQTGKPVSTTTNKGNGLETVTQSFTYPNLFSSTGQTMVFTPSWVYMKPKAVTTTATRQGQPAYTRKQDFTYNNANGLLLSTVSDPGTSYAQTTTNTYDQYGNPIQKTVSTAGLSPRTEVFQYDATNRYVIKSYNTDYPALQTNTEYNTVTGTVSKITQADGLTKTFTYDGFNRVKTTADNIGSQSTTINIWAAANPNAPANAKYGVQVSTNTGGTSFTFYDRLGRVVRTASPGFNGQMIFVDQAYDSKGQLISKSDPYFQGAAQQNNIFTYDIQGRMVYQSSPSGNNTAFIYATTTNGAMTVATNAASQSKKTYTDKSGAVIKTQDEGGTLEYIYHSNGKVKTAALNGTAVQQYEYDPFGRNTKRTDPNYGSYEYTYDNFDQLLSEKDPKGQVYNYTYNSLGKMTTKSGPEGTYAYIYNTAGGPNAGKLIQLTGPNGATHNYSYGMGDQVNYEMKSINGEVFKTQYVYDAYGRIATTIYPNGTAINHKYNNNGYYEGIIQANSPSVVPLWLYHIKNQNAFGQTTLAYFGESGSTFKVKTEQQYNAYGILTQQLSTTANNAVIRQYQYNFQPTTGNLLQRKDIKYSLKEDFTYDNVNRLTGIQGQNYGPVPAMFTTQTMNYAQNGNITQKADAGSFSYDQANRISEVNPYINIPTATQNITYTPFDKVATIEEGPNKALFTYWADGDRARMEFWENNQLKKARYYADNYEKETDITGRLRELCYVYGPEGTLVAVLEKEYGINKTRLVLTDHLESITHILNEQGSIVQEKSYDAWGRSRNPLTWAALPPTGMSNDWDRGYTGQEHLPQFGIINLNGRLYDPLLGRMMEPDPMIIGTNNSQGYNRYSYALNNPLKYTDPDGHHPLIVAAAVGAAISAAMYTYNVASSDGGFNNWSWRGFASNVIIGAASGAATYGIGSAFGAVGSNALGSLVLSEAARAAAHGTASALFTMVGNGGEWSWSSFASGAVGSLAGIATAKISILQTPVASLGFSMTMGGVSSSITGGNFLEGAVTTGLVHSLNQGMHNLRKFPSFKKLWDAYPPDNPDGTHAHPSNDGYPNQCAIRLGYAFKRAGEDISSYDRGNQTSEGYPRWSKGLAWWIGKKYGPPLKMSQEVFKQKYWNNQGVIYLDPPPGGIGHIDLFNHGTTGSGYYLAKEVWFWPIK